MRRDCRTLPIEMGSGVHCGAMGEERSDSERARLGASPGPGNHIGPFTIDASLGSGGVASVYRAHDAKGQVVALKVLHPSRVVDEDKKRFTREYEALSRMTHPNVVKVFGAGVDEGFPWLAMELVEGTDLGALIERWQADPPADRFEQVEAIFRGLCFGLSYVHSFGLIHRDLKPSNVLVGPDGVAKLTDFGVVKDPHAQGTSLTMVGRLVGTVAFMAPEQITGEQLDQRCDLYALGAVLYVMLCFHRPIEASSVAGYLARHLTEVPKAPSEYDGRVPARLERICQRLLLKDPSQRYPTAQAVLEALDRPDDGGLLPLRGREELMAEWAKRLEALRAGAGGVVALIGDAGWGRTHLLRHFVDNARGSGLFVVHGEGTRDPLGALLVGTDITIPGPHDDIGNRLIRGLRGAGTRVLVVDDADRAQPNVIAALARVVRQLVANEGEPILLVLAATSESGPAESLIDGGSGGLPAEVFRIEPLDRKAVGQLLRDRGVQGAALAALTKRLTDDHHGRPGPLVDQLEAMITTGWLERVGDLVRSKRPLEDLRDLPLPVPPSVRHAIEAQLAQLDAEGRAFIEVLAVLERGAPPEFVAAAAGALDPDIALALAHGGLLVRERVEDQDVVRLAHPATATIVRDRCEPERLRSHHLAVARQIARKKRREASVELARHLREGGDVLAAYPAFIQAGRAASRAGRINDVLAIVEEARALQAEAERSIEQAESVRQRRWLFLLEGEARLARGEWSLAIDPLERAVAAARVDTDRASLGRALASLGRAHYRLGRFERARPVLEESLEDFDPGAPERAGATRALADILLRSGDVPGAERMWEQAHKLAEQIGSRDGEARARRGLANVRVVQGRLDDASRLLDSAEELLGAEGDARVRSGLLARSIELDTAAGRLGSALRRAESLLDLLQNPELSERLPEAWALCAEARLAVGETEAAVDAARRAILAAKISPDGDARIRSSRVLLAAGHAAEALAALPAPEELSGQAVDDPAAQVAALRARIVAGDVPSMARDLASWVSVRPPALLALRHARTMLDATLAFVAVGETEAARGLAKRGLKALQGTNADELSLEILKALEAAQPDERVRGASTQIAARIAQSLSPSLAASFLKRFS